MLPTLARYWWVLALRGALAIIFGILAVLWPGLTLITLVLFFGAYAFVDGIFAVIAGITSRERDQRWWAAVLEGIAGIIFGVLTFVWPGMTALERVCAHYSPLSNWVPILCSSEGAPSRQSLEDQPICVPADRTMARRSVI